MCGRFAAAWEPSLIGELLHAELAPHLPHPSWNISPQSSIAIALATAQGHTKIVSAYWSLIPTTSPTAHLAYPTFNARVESALSKPTYAASAERMRAIIPVSGYYEWKSGREPYYFSLDDGKPLWLAGLYSWWPERELREEEASKRGYVYPVPGKNFSSRLSATILTQQAQGEPAQVHSRMPVFVPDNLVPDWLNRSVPGREIFPELQRLSTSLLPELDQHRVAPLKGDGEQLTNEWSPAQSSLPFDE